MDVVRATSFTAACFAGEGGHCLKEEGSLQALLEAAAGGGEETADADVVLVCVGRSTGLAQPGPPWHCFHSRGGTEQQVEQLRRQFLDNLGLEAVFFGILGVSAGLRSFRHF